MRRGLIMLITLLMHVLNAFPQGPAFGVKAGVIQNQEMGDPQSQFENKFKVGFHTGVNADIPVTPQMTVQSELQYAMFGSVYISGEQKSRYKANYLLIPVMAKYNLDNGLSFSCGPQIGALVHASTVVDGKRYDIREDMKKTDFFLVFGVDYRVKSGMSLGFRYQRGLMDVGNDANTSLKNRGFSLNVSYRLGDDFKELLRKIF